MVPCGNGWTTAVEKCRSGTVGEPIAVVDYVSAAATQLEVHVSLFLTPFHWLLIFPHMSSMNYCAVLRFEPVAPAILCASPVRDGVRRLQTLRF